MPSSKHFTSSCLHEATGMYACACMFVHLYCLEMRVEITVIESASTVGGVKLLFCNLAFPRIILTYWDTKCSKFWVWDKSWYLLFMYTLCVCFWGVGYGSWENNLNVWVLYHKSAKYAWFILINCKVQHMVKVICFGTLHMEFQCIVASYHINISFPASWFDMYSLSHVVCLNRFTFIQLVLCLLWYLSEGVGLFWWWNVSLIVLAPCFYTLRTISVVPII